MENKYLTVSALNRYLAYKFDTDPNLREVYIKGEISNLRLSGGHLYFSLKDALSEIRAIVFGSVVRCLNFMPADGMTVLIRASVTVYQKGGTYNLNVVEMKEAGLGDIYLNFLRLKEKLQKEGLFDEERKLKVPEAPEKIAVITSPTGDALQDILTTINKRYPFVTVYLYPALVQGADAPRTLISALERANRDGLVDVIIIARGGGSFEDLSCFNNETLARAIAASTIPTVTGIGHETDYTIADFVSSRRAPTPTGAAVMVTKDRQLLAREVNEKTNLLRHLFTRILENKYKEWERLTYSLKVHSPLQTVTAKLERVTELRSRLVAYNIAGKIDEKVVLVSGLTNRLTARFQQAIANWEKQYLFFHDKINILNPLNIMKKGYTLTYQDGRLITRRADVDPARDIAVRFYDGELAARPKKTKDEE
jgi:exodeoxyribonuclease VII large subunit